ncbi:MAG TPA: exopolysaccharide biosynthesis protein, partial [Paracoccaceae bacterium]|nr:exopolysaccharide biosynthesis protein [Paracoccaceae bacterium]
SGRTVLLDLDLRNPGLAGLFGLAAPLPMRDLLSGRAAPEAQLIRAGRGLALGLNGRAEAAAAELLLEPAAQDALAAVLRDLEPDVLIYDVAPVLGSDEVVALLPQTDAVLLVADGTQTTAADLRACERMFQGRVPLLGVVLNRAQDRGLARLLRRGG